MISTFYTDNQHDMPITQNANHTFINKANKNERQSLPLSLLFSTFEYRQILFNMFNNHPVEPSFLVHSTKINLNLI